MKSPDRSGGPQSGPVDSTQTAQIVNEFRQRLRKAGRPQVLKEYRRLYGNEIEAFGVKAAEVYKIGQDAVRRVRPGGLPLAITVAEALVKSRNLEEGLLGTQLVGSMARLITGSEFEHFERWANYLTNSQTAEGLGINCVAHAIAAKPSIAMRIQGWAQSENPWIRCAAVASLVPLVREGRFTTDALDIAAIVMTETQPEVQRTVGNMLMDASRLRQERVIEFLESWKGRASKRVLQLAANKLPSEVRASILRG